MRGRVILPAGRNYTRRGAHQIVWPNDLPPGMQSASARVRYQLVSCAEARCEGCRGLHKVPSWERPTYTITYKDENGQGQQEVVTEDEYINRLGEGVEALQTAIERKG